MPPTSDRLRAADEGRVKVKPITVYVVVNGVHPLDWTCRRLAKDARRAICNEFQRTWDYLQQKGYRVVKCVLTEATKESAHADQ